MNANLGKFTFHLTLLVVVLVVAIPFLALAGNVPGFNFETILDSDCQVGNLNPPGAPPVPGIFTGNESYAYHIYPADQCDCVEEGFVLEAITQYLYFEDEQIPAAFFVQGSLLKAEFDASIGCWVPGPLLYQGPREVFTIVESGQATIQVLTPGIPAFPLADHYFLVLEYLGCSQALLVVDDEPMPCTEFINRGNGWEDLFNYDKSGGGKIIVFGDIVCSPLAVSTTTSTWDGIKSLYR